MGKGMGVSMCLDWGKGVSMRMGRVRVGVRICERVRVWVWVGVRAAVWSRYETRMEEGRGRYGVSEARKCNLITVWV